MVGGLGADTWSSPCGGAPSITQPTALFLTPSPPPGCDCCKVGVQRQTIPTPCLELDYVIMHKSELAQGAPEGAGFPASLSFPFLPKLVLQLNLFLGIGVGWGGDAPDPSLGGSRGDEDEAYMQFSPRGCGQRAFCN